MWKNHRRICKKSALCCDFSSFCSFFFSLHFCGIHFFLLIRFIHLDPGKGKGKQIPRERGNKIIPTAMHCEKGKCQAMDVIMFIHFNKPKPNLYCALEFLGFGAKSVELCVEHVNDDQLHRWTWFYVICCSWVWNVLLDRLVEFLRCMNAVQKSRCHRLKIAYGKCRVYSNRNQAQNRSMTIRLGRYLWSAQVLAYV